MQMKKPVAVFGSALFAAGVAIAPTAAPSAWAAPGSHTVAAAPHSASANNPYRTGYRQGFRDGWADARDNCEQNGGNNGYGQNNAQWKLGYGDGYQAGYIAAEAQFCGNY
ncbi:hypothetical protein [Peterkaempfera griseoplana]|uniref:hypothetical protein n=1 Tax=Peterkaempfera griseoplana TaxID=66896 RepID=UPI0006E39663|nr:hypothetical protein [Peterkaempfera griseoplana]